jgi:hypothetical protein
MVIIMRNQNKRLKAVIDMAGPRYTSGLNVDVSISGIFDGFGRTFTFYDQLKKRTSKFVSAVNSYDSKKAQELLGDKFFAKLLADSTVLVDLTKKIPDAGGKFILPFEGIYSQANKVNKRLDEAFTILRVKKEEERKKNPVNENNKNEYRAEPFNEESNYLNRLANEVRELMHFVHGRSAKAANRNFIVLRGEAGSGKTHFLCDLTKHRLENKLPTLMFLGQEFSEADPWKTILQKISWAGNKDQFLQSLEKVAANKKTRAFIIVDAVNEGRGRIVWSKLFDDISRYKSISLILSVRMGFEFIVLPKALRKEAHDVIHEGFADREWDALTSFFQFYNLEPDLPLLFPDFTNPLFLKIFCETYQSNGSTVRLRGHSGFTKIFERYVKKQGKKVIEEMGGDSSMATKLVWWNTIKKIADYMVTNKTDRILVSDAEVIAEGVFPGRSAQYLGFLEKNWLLLKNPVQSDNPPYGVTGFDYAFPYQKFSDHLIVRHLLSDSATITDPKTLFAPGGKLHYIMESTNWWKFRGVIEALAVQIPERFEGKELISLVGKSFERTLLAKQSFLHSLIWRDMELKNGKLRFFNEKTILEIVNQVIIHQHADGFDDVMETMLTVAAIPKHPLNALRLSGYLQKFDLAQKDKIWIPFLFYKHNNSSAVDRLVHWAVKISHKTSYDDESIKLVAICLGWFLSSSNRYLRDESTKALVVLLKNRVHILIDVLKHFERINDPYITERLYATAYGCTMIVTDPKVQGLALYVYKKIFKTKPPVHLLIRDYARGIVETAVRKYQDLEEKINIKRVRPPYKSAWPKRFPNLKGLKKKYKEDIFKDDRSGYSSIWWSLMYNNEGGISDFGNYVLNSAVGRWSNRKLLKNGTSPKSKKQIADEFEESLSPEKKDLWEKYQNARRASFLISFSFYRPGDILKKTKKEGGKEKTVAGKKATEARHVFEASLSQREFEKYKKLRGYMEGVRAVKDDDLDFAAIQRWVFKKVIDLGWKPELFYDFDSRNGSREREANKSERIGKKYQWIALHEILARIADNFAFKDWNSSYYSVYQGPWDLYQRDIDPSHSIYLFDAINQNAVLWKNKKYKEWSKSIPHDKWVKRDDVSKLVDKFFFVKDELGEEWALFSASHTWKEPEKPGTGSSFSNQRREVFILSRAYLIKSSDTQKILEWAKGKKNTWGWLPEPRTITGIYLGEIPYSSAYADNYGEKNPWKSLKDEHGGEIGMEVLPVSEYYMNEATTFDCSVKDAVHVNLPTKSILDMMGLKSNGIPGEFVDSSGVLVAQDPSVKNGGEGCLVIRKSSLIKFLKDNDYSILWSVFGEKLVLGMNRGPGVLEFGGTYIMDGDKKMESANYKGMR